MNMKNLRLRSPLKSVGMKLFIIIFCAILLCVLVVGLSSYSTARSIIKEKVADSGAIAMEQSKGKLDLLFKNYEELSMQVLVDRTLQSDLVLISRSKEDYERFQASARINEALQKYAIGNQSISNVALIPVDKKLKSVTAGYEIREAQDKEWFKQVVELDGKAKWFPVMKQGLGDSGTTPTFALTRLIKNTSSDAARYVLVIEIQMKQLERQLEDLHLGDNGFVTIVDGDNNYVYHPEIDKIGTPANVQLPAWKDEKNNDRGSLEAVDTNGNEVLAVYNKFETMDWRLLGTVPVEELVKDASKISQMTWIIAGVAALLASAIGWFVVWMVAMPLVRLRNLMNEGAEGNLTVRSDFNSRDEIGQLAQSFNQMMTQITDLVNKTNQTAQDVLLTAGELTDASKKTAVAAQEIAIATEEIAGGAMSLAVEAEKGSDLTSDLSNQMKHVVELNNQMTVSADEVEESSRQGIAYMNTLIDRTGMTEDMVRSMVEKVDRLKDSTRSIRKILEVLQNMTKQTNILSLNATIEAARAGNAGKGFMVVADEIRKLADQSRQSIDVVGQITVTIQKEIDETVDVLSDAYPIFKEQIGSVREANEIFLSVQDQMGQFIECLSGATQAVTQLERSQGILSETMSSVSAVAEQSSATSEEVASLSSEQTNISQGLVQLSDKLEKVSKELSGVLAAFRT